MKEETLPEEAPAGWYPAPHANNEQRYWDGQRWHDQAPPPPVVTMPEQSPEVSEPPAPFLAPTPVPPSSVKQSGGSRKLAVAALSLGAAAFLTGFVPVLGLLLAIAAVALGVLALMHKQPKGFAIAGLALGGVALLTGVVVTSVVFTGSGAESTASSTVEPAEVAPEAEAAAPPAETPAEPAAEPAAPAAEEPEDVEPEAAAASGTSANPAPQPYIAEGLFGGDKYSLTGRIVEANGNALVAEWNMFNSEAPAGFKYVITELTMTGIDPDGVEPSLASIDLSLATGEGNLYDNEYVTFGAGISSMTNGPTLYPGSAFTGYTAYIVPEAAQSFMLYDNGKYIAF